MHARTHTYTHTRAQTRSHTGVAILHRVGDPRPTEWLTTTAAFASAHDDAISTNDGAMRTGTHGPAIVTHGAPPSFGFVPTNLTAVLEALRPQVKGGGGGSFQASTQEYTHGRMNGTAQPAATTLAMAADLLIFDPGVWRTRGGR